MALNWEITDQRQIDDLNQATGSFIPSMEVHYRTIPEGIPGMIVVPFNRYTPDNVREAIDQRVNAIKEVQNL